MLVYHFVAEGYQQRQSGSFSGAASDLGADLEFLMRVAQKVETIREDLGNVGPVLADDVEAAMLGHGYVLANTTTAEQSSEPVRKMLKFERDLVKQIKALLDQYNETRKELRLSSANVQKVVEVGLKLADQPALIPVKNIGGKPIFQLPALQHSWAACREGLEHPHTKETRPITFDENKDQLERNKDFLRNRVTQIPDEITRETEAIRARYLDPQARMFPVAVTFLVPRKMAE